MFLFLPYGQNLIFKELHCRIVTFKAHNGNIGCRNAVGTMAMPFVGLMKNDVSLAQL